MGTGRSMKMDGKTKNQLIRLVCEENTQQHRPLRHDRRPGGSSSVEEVLELPGGPGWERLSVIHFC